MLKKTLLTLMLAAVATVAAGETVYKWVDARGQVHYTDRPPTQGGARVLGVLERSAGFDEATDDDQDEPSPPAWAGPSTDDTGSSTAAAAAVQRDLEAIRGEQCTQAQARYKQYIESQRLFRQTPDGQRQYLSDAELNQARVEAKQAVDEYCQ